MQYSHRLPADYDMQVIRTRAARRGPLWDDTPGLALKAFVSQTRGQRGAVGNLYASVYLWLDPSAATTFLMGDRFQGVIDSFGRPSVETWLPLHARAGGATQARWLLREEQALAATLDREAFAVSARERDLAVARQADTVAVWSALDLCAWRRVRFTLSSRAPEGVDATSAVYEVLHLARPGLASLAGLA